MTAVHKEITSRYHPDGIFMNRWTAPAIAIASTAGRDLQMATGFELPHTTNPQDPARRAIFTGVANAQFTCATTRTTIRATNSEASIVPNNGSGATSPLNAVEISRRAPMLAADRLGLGDLICPCSSASRPMSTALEWLASNPSFAFAHRPA